VTGGGALTGVLASIPSPAQGVWHLGPLPLRAYAFCILAGIAVAVVVTDRRWRARGGLPGQVGDIVIWAVPAGIIGGRLYHVLTSPEAYFGAGGQPLHALYIWNGGLGIWGAVALGAVGAWIGCRRAGVSLAAWADALAPGLLLAQAVGRFGNWFNQELFGRPTDLPWGLRIDAAHRPPGYQDVATFHPAFLYEALWDAGAALLLLRLERRFRLGFGRTFWTYVVLYTLGRAWIELLRIDTAEHVLGLRLNVWTCILVFCLAVAVLVVSSRRHPGRQESVWLPGRREGAQEGVPAGVPARDGAREAVEGEQPGPAGGRGRAGADRRGAT
jgi:prolipoprotein diacylglyceryl transferase